MLILLETFLSAMVSHSLWKCFIGPMANTTRSFSSLSQHARSLCHFNSQGVSFLLGLNIECYLAHAPAGTNSGTRPVYCHFYIPKKVCLHSSKPTTTEVGLEEFWDSKKMKYHLFFQSAQHKWTKAILIM